MKTAASALAEHERRTERFAFLGERLRNVKVEEVWAVLERDLTLGDGRGSVEHVLRAIDRAEANLRRAGMLYQAAVEEADEFDLHYRAAYSEFSWNAREALERAKKGSRMSGHVTVDMVEDWVAAHVPDYRKWRERRRVYERNRALAKQLHEAWQSRMASLRKQADLAMARSGLDPNMLNRANRKGRE
jgi:hypothetical protein